MKSKPKRGSGSEAPRTLYLYWMEDPFEAQAFFEIIKPTTGEPEKLVYITGWCANDGDFRSEYMGGILEYLGVKLESGVPSKYEKQAKKMLSENFS